MRGRVAGFAAASLLVPLVGVATAGAPAPSVRVEVWSEVPLGAAIRVELRAVMARLLLKRLRAVLTVRRAGKSVAGRWLVDQRTPVTCGERLRLSFAPAASLGAGAYLVRGFQRLKMDFAWRYTWPSYPVEVLATADTLAPSFAGLKEAVCIRPNALLGCVPSGIKLVAPAANDTSRTRLVTCYRKRGAPYRPDGCFEAGRICEVALIFPTRGCRGFPTPKARSGALGVMGRRATGGIKALSAPRECSRAPVRASPAALSCSGPASALCAWRRCGGGISAAQQSQCRIETLTRGPGGACTFFIPLAQRCASA